LEDVQRKTGEVDFQARFAALRRQILLPISRNRARLTFATDLSRENKVQEWLARPFIEEKELRSDIDQYQGIKLKVNVRFFATLREIAGRREEEVELSSGSTVGDLLNRLVELHGSRFREYVMDETTGTSRGHLLFLVDGTSISSLEGLKTRLTEGCAVAIMPPVGGG